MPFISHNPSNGEAIAHFSSWDASDLTKALDSAHLSQKAWKDQAFSLRVKVMREIAARLRAQQERLAKLATQEMGKPLHEARSELNKCAMICEFYADHAEAFLSNLNENTEARRSYVQYEPLGIILGIMPWNFPYWQVMRFVAPALMAGNAVALKHAPNVQQCAEALAEILSEAGLPIGVFLNLQIEVDLVEQAMTHPAVQAVAMTGSERTGRTVAALAGTHLKKCVLELGGSDPFVVLADADLEFTLERAVQSRFSNAGQACIAAKRFIVVPEIADRFTQGLLERVRNLKVGDPMLDDTQVGPLARQDLRDQLHEQVMRTLEMGGKSLLGCHPIPGPGYFYAPSVIDNAPAGSPARQEEIFGPVAVIVRAQDEKDALKIANETRFGLGASIWSRNSERAERLLGEIQAGLTFVNSIVKSDPRLPFGGVKASGFGRELSFHGIREFCQARTVWVSDSPSPHSTER
jgi:succinate-semialdehyde dehydrogenase / glutarate-semialdehyde dehydrogenase